MSDAAEAQGPAPTTSARTSSTSVLEGVLVTEEGGPTRRLVTRLLSADAGYSPAGRQAQHDGEQGDGHQDNFPVKVPVTEAGLDEDRTW